MLNLTLKFTKTRKESILQEQEELIHDELEQQEEVFEETTDEAELEETLQGGFTEYHYKLKRKRRRVDIDVE
ncbi:hypothetical protein [Flammeovirga kamogawensis]|uniref:Uncharacterized protein n=1 Tax=Flammeovirga kamogawensis TaxID=373891 RepID=A0ABX8GT07_9BACT|nr:hypothetical protein [Flammeovirga kamogawensis]MBB6463337.1 hypothetical protein [Flammeovirga kamogawensis]QWG06691.1 hypothetical protein KM029_15445 [Flammeovirga kamogawensis]TRX68513.1 hypothetical protein EO216_10440 [Flammeovirga kamogawensis]